MTDPNAIVSMHYQVALECGVYSWCSSNKW